jgi:hypothetical protein
MVVLTVTTFVVATFIPCTCAFRGKKITKTGYKKTPGGGIRAFNGRAFFFSLFFSHSNFKVPKPYLSSIPKGIFELKTTQ